MSSPSTYPGAAETNDARDNQCPGDAGYGLVDEVSGTLRFTSPQELCWGGQTGATRYQVARAADPTFSANCVSTLTSAACLDVPEIPAEGGSFYLVRADLPNPGSWGADSSGQEHGIVCP